MPADIPLVDELVVPAGTSTVEWSVSDGSGNATTAQSSIELDGASLTTRLYQTEALQLPAESSFLLPEVMDVAGNYFWLPLRGRLRFSGSSGDFECRYDTVPWSSGEYSRDRLNFTHCSNGAVPGDVVVADSIELVGGMAFGIPPLYKPEFFATLGCQ